MPLSSTAAHSKNNPSQHGLVRQQKILTTNVHAPIMKIAPTLNRVFDGVECRAPSAIQLGAAGEPAPTSDG